MELKVETNIVTKKEIREEQGLTKLIASYSPSVKHSEDFCDVTRDPNPIHRSHPVYKEAISPGLLQISVHSLLIKELIRGLGMNPSDYPYSDSSSRMEKPVVTGGNYNFEITLDSKQEESLEFSVVLTDHKGKEVSTTKIKSSSKKSKTTPISPSDLVHKNLIHPKKALYFKDIIGSASSESNLYALASSSFIICDAINKSRLPPLEENVVGLYASQDIVSDSSKSLDFKAGIDLELFISNIEGFGKLSEKGEAFDVYIVARDIRSELLYVSHCPISFQRKKIVDIILKKELRKR